MPVEWSINEQKIVNKIHKDGGLTVGVIVQSPYVQPCFQQSVNLCPQPGLAIDLMRETCKLMEIPCRFIKVC